MDQEEVERELIKVDRKILQTRAKLTRLRKRFTYLQDICEHPQKVQRIRVYPYWKCLVCGKEWDR